MWFIPTEQMKGKNRKNDTRKWLWALFGLLIIIPYVGLYGVKCWYDQKVAEIANARIIIVDKEKMKLSLMDYNGEEVKSYGISCGKNYGNKHERGDMKTPSQILRTHLTGDTTSKTAKGALKGHTDLGS